MLERIAAMAECGAATSLPAFNAEYAKHFGGALPARSCVQAVLYQGAKVEIEVQAFVTEVEFQGLTTAE